MNFYVAIAPYRFVPATHAAGTWKWHPRTLKKVLDELFASQTGEVMFQFWCRDGSEATVLVEAAFC